MRSSRDGSVIDKAPLNASNHPFAALRASKLGSVKVLAKSLSWPSRERVGSGWIGISGRGIVVSMIRFNSKSVNRIYTLEMDNGEIPIEGERVQAFQSSWPTREAVSCFSTVLLPEREPHTDRHFMGDFRVEVWDNVGCSHDTPSPAFNSSPSLPMFCNGLRTAVATAKMSACRGIIGN